MRWPARVAIGTEKIGTVAAVCCVLCGSVVEGAVVMMTMHMDAALMSWQC